MLKAKGDVRRAFAMETLAGIQGDCAEEVGPACEWVGVEGPELAPNRRECALDA